MAKYAQELVKDLGFVNGDPRKYSFDSPDGKFCFLMARAKNIPEYVENGTADLGITGRDLVLEMLGSGRVSEIIAFPFGVCRLVYATPKGATLAPKRIATAFPNISTKFVKEQKIAAQVITLSGAVEASVASGIADAIIDLTSTGKTLIANGLEERATVVKSSAVLIANKNSLESKKDQIEQVLKRFRNDFPLFSKKLDDLSPEDKWKLFWRKPPQEEKVREIVRGVFDKVARERDDAVCEYIEKFQGIVLKPKELEVSRNEIKQAYAEVNLEIINSLKKSLVNLERFSKKELPQKWEIKTEGGFMGKKVVPLDVVGVYVPGGTAAYPSSVLMGVIPARVAGVKEIVLCTPCDKNGKCNSAVLVAADLAGATKIFRVGGSQAIAAMAIGTRTIPRVAKIVGPGNIYVAAAKQEALSRALVSIDSPAGPSEVLIIADETCNPKFVAADLLAQAEHDVNACVVLVSTSLQILKKVEEAVKLQLMLLPRKAIARTSLVNNGAFLLAPDLENAVEFCNAYAPEHLELVIERPFVWLEKVRNAGAVFLGNYSCEAAGDYSAGPNHVLPTGGAARNYSGLSTRDFVREMNYLKLDKIGLEKLKDEIVTIANAEGLTAHANSVLKRFEEDGNGNNGDKND